MGMGINIMTKKEIQDEIQRLSFMLKDIEKDEREAFKETAKNNIGRCFIVGGKYIKIIDIPHEFWYKSGECDFNPYQYKGLFLGNKDGSSDMVPFYFDDVFSGIWGIGNSPFKRQIQEISKEEFEQEFDKVIAEFKNKYVI